MTDLTAPSWPLAGKPELAEDERFATMKARAANIPELYRIAGECVAARTTAEWLHELGKVEIPCGPITALEDLAKDAHLSAIGFFREMEHPSEGMLTVPDVPIRYNSTPAGVHRLQPHLGEHSLEVLAETGFKKDEIDALVSSKATVDGRVKKSKKGT